MRCLVSLIAVLAASTASAAATMYPVPSGAIDTRHFQIQPGVYEEDSYRFPERYPRSSALDHYAAIFAGWRPCLTGDDGWQSFADASGTQPRFIHQLIRHWVNSQNDEAVTLLLRYESPGLSTREAPSTDDQFVAVTRLRHPGADKHFEAMGAKCVKAPNKRLERP
jgi:hypothetical protein